ncbi:MAG: type II secretion system F family protein [Pirellulaceae bacterium]
MVSLTVLIPILVFVGIATLVGGVALMFRSGANEDLENRLEILAGATSHKGAKGSEQNSLLYAEDETDTGALIEWISKYFNLRLYLDQAAIDTSVGNFVMISAGLAAGAAVVPILLGLPFYFGPVMAIVVGFLPLLWAWWKRGSRLAAFGKQLPDALELIARALRAGHSLGAGFQLVADEMQEPIGGEFRDAFEAQNLGVSLENSITNMTERVPNLDLKFFATAIILQRQTGGDLAEILDKIGRLIRMRMELYGQIQALTGEGRISGIVLLGLPPVLFIVMWRLNPSYVMTLFTDPLGNQMLAGAVVMQLLGAWVIHKIIDIKV